jgi:hypothetical protein
VSTYRIIELHIDRPGDCGARWEIALRLFGRWYYWPWRGWRANARKLYGR